MAITPGNALRRLYGLRQTYCAGASAAKREAMRLLARARLPRAGDVYRLHETLCLLRAYPDDRRVLEAAERILRGFARRPDLRRHAELLADSGIDGTPIHYCFFWPMARWLATRWPERLELDWNEPEFEDRLRSALPQIVPYAEAEALRMSSLSARAALDLLRGRGETDAVFLIRRIEAMPGDAFTREAVHDSIDAAYVLRPGPGGPSRTWAIHRRSPVAFRTEPPSRVRPDLLREILRPPRSVRTASPREGARLVDVAREAMVTRSRDLDAFAHGDARDVRIVDDGDGLQFAAIGMVPERRLLLPAVYGYLTLQNGVPMGYVQSDALFGNVEIAFNTFATFRGGEAARIFARVLAMTRHLFSASSFSIEPYQLGHGNAEGIESGAWWFYYKLGFRPKDPAVRRVARRELARMKADPAHRSSASVLEKLSEAHLFLEPDPALPAVLAPTEALGARISRELARRSGADREAALVSCVDEAARRLRTRSFAGWTAGERLWWSRFAPIVAALPGLDRWSVAEKRALAAVIRAKGGRRESDFVRLFDAHPKLARAVIAATGRVLS